MLFYCPKQIRRTLFPFLYIWKNLIYFWKHTQHNSQCYDIATSIQVLQDRNGHYVFLRIFLLVYSTIKVLLRTILEWKEIGSFRISSSIFKKSRYVHQHYQNIRCENCFQYPIFISEYICCLWLFKL